MPTEPSEPGSTRKSSPTRSRNEPVDLVELVRTGHLTGKIESPEFPAERRSRLIIEEAKVKHELRKEMVILVATLIGLGTIFLLCLVIAIRPGPSEDKKWAMSVLATIVSGGVGYLARGRANKPD
jgi:hypothetical protein